MKHYPTEVIEKMSKFRNTILGLLIALSLFVAAACTTEPVSNTNVNTAGSPTPSASVSPAVASNAVPVPLPVLDALFSDEPFKAQLKTKLALTDDQVAQVQKIAGDEVARLRQLNAEEPTAAQSDEAQSQAAASRDRAAEAIRGAIGEQKAADLFAFARDYWTSGNQAGESAPAPPSSSVPTPNSIPKDTRIVVNIPAYRMDVFREGELVKTYKIGIGY